MTTQGIGALNPLEQRIRAPEIEGGMDAAAISPQPALAAPEPALAAPEPALAAPEPALAAPLTVDLPRLVFSKPQFEGFLTMLEESQEGVPDEQKTPAVDLFAQQLALEAEAANPGLITFQGLRDGTAPIFDLMPDFKNVSPNLRKFSSDDIIELFAVDPKGNPIQRGKFVDPFVRETVVLGGGLAGAAAGWQIGSAAQQGIAPSNVAAVGAKVTIPVVGAIGGMLGFFAGTTIGKGVEQAVLGEEMPILPSYREEYESAKTAAGVGVYLPLPFMIGKNASFATATYLANMATSRAAAARVGPMTVTERTLWESLTPQAKIQAAKKKDPVWQRLLGALEGTVARTGESARSAPGATLALETLMGVGATGGAYMAETLVPGDWRWRLVGEMGGSVGAIAATAPTNFVVSQLGNLTSIFKSSKKKFQQEGASGVMSPIQDARKRKAVDKVYSLLIQHGEDVPALIKGLSDLKTFKDPKTGELISPTAGLKTGSPTLLGIENALDQLGGSLGKNRNQASQQMLDALNVVVFSLIDIGDQKSYQMAGEIMNSVFETNLQNRLTDSTDKALSAFQRVVGDGAEDSMELSSTLSQVLESNMTLARNKERQLYSAVQDSALDLNEPRFLKVWKDSLPKYPVPREAVSRNLSDLSTFITNATKPKEIQLDPGLDVGDAPESATTLLYPGEDAPVETSVIELIEMRSLALSQGRKLRADGNTQASAVAFKMADAFLDDIDASIGKNSAYTIAREYSRALNDTFTRAFVGKTGLKDKTGTDRMAPELLMDKLFQGGANPTYLRLMDINDVGTFLVEQNIADAETSVGTLADVTDKMVRKAATEIFDQATGTVSPTKLADWRRKNAAILQKLPTLDEDMADVEKAGNIIALVTQENSVMATNAKAQLNFKNLLADTNESPTQVIALALGGSAPGRTPTKSLNELYKVVESAPEELKESAARGMKHSILEWGLTYGGSSAKVTSPSAAYSALFEKIPKALEDTTPMTWMLEKKLITQSEMNTLKKTLVEMVKYEAMDQSGDVGELVEKAGPLLDMYIRISGSNLGAQYSKMMGGSGSDLIARSAGSRMMTDMFNKMPASMKTDVMSELMQNPALLAAMLRETNTQKGSLGVARTVKNMFTDLGFSVARRAVPMASREARLADEEEPLRVNPDIAVIPGGRADFAAQLRRDRAQQAAGLNAQSQPRVQAPRPVAPPPQAPQQMAPPPQAAPPPISSSGPVDRERYAALFPEDRDLLGIGSLMGNA